MHRIRQVYKGLIDFSSFETPAADAATNPSAQPAPEAMTAVNPVAPVITSPGVPPAVNRSSVPMSEDDAMLERALQANEDADEIDFDDEYLQGAEIGKVSIDQANTQDERARGDKKRGGEGLAGQENVKMFKLDNA